MATLRRIVDHPWFSWIRLGVVFGGWVAWARDGWSGWVVLLAASPLLVQFLAGRFPRLSFIDVALILFLFTAGVGLWA